MVIGTSIHVPAEQQAATASHYTRCHARSSTGQHACSLRGMPLQLQRSAQDVQSVARSRSCVQQLHAGSGVVPAPQLLKRQDESASRGREGCTRIAFAKGACMHP